VEARTIAPRRLLVLDSGALIVAESDERIEAVLRKYLREGAFVLIPSVCLAECIRGGPRDVAANRLIKAIGRVEPIDESLARAAGALLAECPSDSGKRSSQGRSNIVRSALTIDAMVVAIADAHKATDILTSDRSDIASLADGRLNIIAV
jgi:predicted nucleic acid-binding protein